MATSRKPGPRLSGSEAIAHPAYGAESTRSGARYPRRPLSLTGLAARQLGGRRAWTSALALGLVAATALASAVPLAGAMAADATLHSTLGSLGRLAALTVVKQQVADQSGFESFEAQAAHQVDGRLGRYLNASTALATLGPLDLASVNENRAPADSGGVNVGYLRDIADRVELVAGTWPPDGLGGSSDVAASMAQSRADALGLHLGDRLCVDLSRAGARWCTRVAALWRPLGTADPFRLAAERQVPLAIGRYDFYRLMRQTPSPAATVGRQFFLDVGAVDTRNAGDVVNGLRELRTYFAGRGELFETSLDQAIVRFEQAQRPVQLASELLSVSLLVLLLFAVSLFGGQFLRLQTRETALLRARGWPRRRIRGLLLRQVAAVVLVSIAIGVALALSLTAAAGITVFAVRPPWPDGSDRQGLLLAGAAAAAGLLTVWSILARLSSAAAGRPIDGEREAGVRPPHSTARRWRGLMVLALVAAVALLAAARWLQGLRPLAITPVLLNPGPLADWLSVLASVGAALLLGLATLRTLPLAGSRAGRGTREVAGRLAGWQLSRRPEQHRPIVFLLGFAMMAATFGGVAAVLGYEQGRELLVEAVVVAGAAAAALIALLGFGFHFRLAAGERAEEYAALVLSGLPPRAVRRSLALEQRAVTWQGLAFGALFGVALALALLPLADLRTHAASEAEAVGCVLAGFVLAVLATGWAVRRWLGRLDLRRVLRVLV
jgi:hypothetical protein